MPTRLELQELAEQRLKSVKTLLEKEFYDFVCHDCGYVLEFGLKSAVCKNILSNIYPENDNRYKTHSLDKLVDLASLKIDLENEKRKSIDFFINWSLVSKWSVSFRYDPIGKNKKETAEEYIKAIENQKDGVFPWIKKNW